MPLDFGAATALLEAEFDSIQQDFAEGRTPEIDDEFRTCCRTLFRSRTQAFREVLLGCTLARLQDRAINVLQPYADQGPHAFSGRSFDEGVVNPFLRIKRIPSSRGPYLSVFRRSVQFVEATRAGLRDGDAYDALLQALHFLQAETDEAQLQAMLRIQLYEFFVLREGSQIPLSTLHRISLDQCDVLITGLLATPSQGRFPVVLTVAALKTISEYFGQTWTVEVQGINVPDSPSGAGGDITVTSGDRVLFVAEVTERPIDRARVVTTFQTKIAPNAIEEYLFFVGLAGIAQDARQQAHQYFAQGHEVNFLEVKTWILMALATMGRRGRELFEQHVLSQLAVVDMPRHLKVAWNNHIEKLVGSV